MKLKKNLLKGLLDAETGQHGTAQQPARTHYPVQAYMAGDGVVQCAKSFAQYIQAVLNFMSALDDNAHRGLQYAILNQAGLERVRQNMARVRSDLSDAASQTLEDEDAALAAIDAANSGRDAKLVLYVAQHGELPVLDEVKMDTEIPDF
ncbi:MAG: hypothetical protein AAF570_11680, partial [Bacteroidota bacterium]